MLSRLDYGNATLAGLPAVCLTVSSLCWMLLLGQSPVFVTRLTLQTLLPVFIGYMHLSEYSLNWRLLFTELNAALCRDTSPTRWVTLLTFHLGVVSTHRPPVNSWSARHVKFGEQSFTSASLILWNSLLDSITAASSLSDFHRKLKTSFSAIITRYCLVVFLATVDLEVVS